MWSSKLENKKCPRSCTEISTEKFIRIINEDEKDDEFIKRFFIDHMTSTVLCCRMFTVEKQFLKFLNSNATEIPS